MFLQSYSITVKEIMKKDIYIGDIDSKIEIISDYLINNKDKEVLITENDKLIGIIKYSDIIGREDNQNIKEIMKKDILILNHNESISDVRLIMRDTATDRLIIMEKDKIVGIIRENTIKDYLYKAIENGEKVIEDLFNYINEAVCVIDNKGRVIIWNNNAQELYNVNKKDIIGKPLKNFFPNAIDLKVLETKESFKNTYHSPKEGYHAIISASPIIVNDKLYGVISIEKGLQELWELKEELEIANEKLSLLEKEMHMDSDDPFDRIIGHSKLIISRIDIAKQIAPTNAAILLTGESGTGKEEFAKAIHKKSGVEGEFVPVNCSAIPSELFESEFFGYESGAFTGASKDGKIGFFEQAKNGTLFLDEIGDMPLSMQVKLLRILQDKQVKKVGGEEFIPVNVRIISATNLDLTKMIEENKFREELYYRINVVEIDLPPLRDRKEDIALFIDYFIKLICLENNKKILKIDNDVVDYLIDYPWYGNIRQLKNVIEHMAIMATGDTIDISLIPKFIKNDTLEIESLDLNNNMDLNTLVENLEISLINKALERSKGSRKEAANFLNIPRTTLHSKMTKYKIN